MHHDLIKATTLEGFNSLVTDLGKNPKTLFERLKLNPSIIKAPEKFISFKSYCQLMEMAANATETPEFGLLLGSRQSLSILGPIGFAMQQSETVGEALRILKRHFYTHDQAARINIRIDTGVAYLTHLTEAKEFFPYTQAKIKSISVANSILRLLCGQGWKPIAVRFSLSSPGNIKAYKKNPGLPCLFRPA